MALIAELDMEAGLCGVGGEGVAARTAYRALDVVGMDSFSHTI
jgi:hypothetical protein